MGYQKITPEETRAAAPVHETRTAQYFGIQPGPPQKRLRKEVVFFGCLFFMLALAWIGEPLVNPIFARSDAIGSVMRKKIEPVMTPMIEQIAQLRGLSG